jgi:hypothetical protein
MLILMYLQHFEKYYSAPAATVYAEEVPPTAFKVIVTISNQSIINSDCSSVRLELVLFNVHKVLFRINKQ